MREDETNMPGTGHPAPSASGRERSGDAPAREPWIVRWRAPLIASLVAVFVVFGVLDVGSMLFRGGNQTRPIVINAQIYEGATPTPRSALLLRPEALNLACQTSAHLTLVNSSTRALHWTLVSPASGIQFSPDSPRSGMLAAGASVTLTVSALGQSGTYEVHVTDDQGATTTGEIAVRCQ